MRKKRTDFARKIWEDADIEALRELSRKHTASEVAVLMERSFASVRCKMQREGIVALSGQNWNEWSSDELAFIDANHETMTADDMAAHLRRTPFSVRKKCWLLGISLKRKLHSDEDVSMCRELFACGLSVKVISEKMEINSKTIAGWISGRHRNNI